VAHGPLKFVFFSPSGTPAPAFSDPVALREIAGLSPSA
jgi:hypothetical protein